MDGGVGLTPGRRVRRSFFHGYICGGQDGLIEILRCRGGGVDETLGHVARLQPGGIVAPVLATGHGDGAEPGFVGGGAVVASFGERVLCAACCIAGDLLERVVEIFVHGGCVGVVDGTQGGDVCIILVVAGDCVGDFIAEG